MRNLINDEIQEVAGGHFWGDCHHCEDSEIENPHPDEFDDDPMTNTDYAPAQPGIWQNYLKRWFTKD